MMTLTKTVGLLILSNLFMTYAWYGHLKDKSKPLMITILLSWGVAFFEYCLQVPANRMGHSVLTAPQLKTLQEAITFAVFALFSYFYLKERPTIYDHASFALIIVAVSISLFQPAK
ncbi:MAG: DMT family protein [Bdellovibrionales bacterium]|nr:DMT family protein [Bdellovibrionales bacterium]